MFFWTFLVNLFSEFSHVNVLILQVPEIPSYDLALKELKLKAQGGQWFYPKSMEDQQNDAKNVRNGRNHTLW